MYELSVFYPRKWKRFWKPNGFCLIWFPGVREKEHSIANDSIIAGKKIVIDLGAIEVNKTFSPPLSDAKKIVIKLRRK